jgi:hypothetical protein
MSKRKWKSGDVKITNLGALMSSMEQFGGVWWFKFMNAESIKSQQFRVLLNLIEKGRLYFPERVEGVKK